MSRLQISMPRFAPWRRKPLFVIFRNLQANGTLCSSTVQSGDRAWLKVAADLKSGTDGGQLETLRIAVSQSIQSQPENFPCGGLACLRRRRLPRSAD
jgi:hypothetical protein